MNEIRTIYYSNQHYIFDVGNNRQMCRNLIYYRIKVMVFKATFNNISVISRRSVYLWRKVEYNERKNIDLPQVTDKRYNVILYHVHLNMRRIRTHNFSSDTH